MTKYKLAGSPGRIGSPKRSSLWNWKGRDEEEDPGKHGEKNEKEIFKCWE